MLPHFLSWTGALYLSGCAAMSLPRTHNADLSSRTEVISTPPLVNVPALGCTFSYEQCTEDVASSTHLAFVFSAENGTLLANNQTIFPSSLPMQLDAQRYWQSGEETVSLTYGLEARPMSSRPDGAVGDITLLKLKLYDLQGRPASDFVIVISLSQDQNKNLVISRVDTKPIASHHHGQPSSWMNRLSANLDAVRDALKECIHGGPPGHPRPGMNPPHGPHGHHMPPPVDKHRTIAPERHDHHGQGYWSSREKNIGKLMRPVVMPALLGVIAGVVACMTGFIVGKVVISIFTCMRRCHKKQSTPAIRLEEVENGPNERKHLMRTFDEDKP
ncbi:hypothetical protein BDV25DRAFT_150472 [Aspergillus avenaceus]|uniref:Uncharacterized protein n=1 Tax=Aspergillus avenaceus TaxID=36643 RepID=A0A5N6U2N0_ASPAV|nr:hypothetical protein BDV25DRAFT_150472 [Aspergillus avenaceus]